MNVLETIEAIRSGLMWIGLSVLAALAAGVVRLLSVCIFVWQ